MLDTAKLTLVRVGHLLAHDVRTVYPHLDELRLRVVIEEEADTASAGLDADADGEIVIILPTAFCGQQVTGALALGLGTHELGHGFWSDLEGWDRQVEAWRKRADGEHVISVANVIEDARTESLYIDPFAGFLRAPRQVVLDDGLAVDPGRRSGSQPYTLYDLLRVIRFSRPWLPYAYPLGPAAVLGIDNPTIAGRIGDHVTPLYGMVDGYATTPQDVVPAEALFAAADLIVGWARSKDLLPPNPPPGDRLGRPGKKGEDGRPGVARGKTRVNAPRGNHKVSDPNGRQDGLPHIANAPDPQILEEGRKLGCRIEEGWASRPQSPAHMGVGRYDARLDHPGAALPPFRLGARPRASLPPRIVICLDVSSSMHGSSYATRLRPARVALAAVWAAVRRLGGRTEFVVFDGSFTQARTVEEAICYQGGSTSFKFLETVVGQWSTPWEYLVITDAEVNALPGSWGPRERERTSILLIGDPRPEYLDRARTIGRVIQVKDTSQLPALLALVARKTASGNRI